MRACPRPTWRTRIFSAAAVGFLIAGALCAAPTAAQQPESHVRGYYGRPVHEVVLVGSESRRAQVRDVGIPVGARLSRGLLRTTIGRLLESGRWADVQLDVQLDETGGVVILAKLVPRLLLTRVDIFGNDVLDEAV